MDGGNQDTGEPPLHGRLLPASYLIHHYYMDIVFYCTCVFGRKLGYQRSQNQNAKENGRGVPWGGGGDGMSAR
jgi:hypothetical protein